MMRKMMLVTTMSMIACGAFGQSKKTFVSTPTFGITGGVNWNTINGKTASGGELDNKVKTGFNGGINMEFPVGNGFYLQPGIEYRQKGTEWDNGNKLNLSYIDIPVNFIYKPTLGLGTMLLGFGPYVGFGINGKIKSSNGSERKVTFDNDYSVSEAQDLQFKKLDAGANFMAGYEFKSKLSAALKAQLGLININPDTDVPNDETRYRNTGFGLSLGYRL
jgi:hypothetical protein